MRSIILNVDVGSSRIRCSAAYEYYDRHSHHNDVSSEEQMMGGDNSNGSSQLVNAIKCVIHTIPLSAITETGNIHIHEVLMGIDGCVDEALKLLRRHVDSYQVVAIRFTTFVMNLVAVDIHGDPVGDAATCSFACNRDDVVKECQSLRE